MSLHRKRLYSRWCIPNESVSFPPPPTYETVCNQGPPSYCELYPETFSGLSEAGNNHNTSTNNGRRYQCSITMWIIFIVSIVSLLFFVLSLTRTFWIIALDMPYRFWDISKTTYRLHNGSGLVSRGGSKRCTPPPEGKWQPSVESRWLTH